MSYFAPSGARLPTHMTSDGPAGIAAWPFPPARRRSTSCPRPSAKPSSAQPSGTRSTMRPSSPDWRTTAPRWRQRAESGTRSSTPALRSSACGFSGRPGSTRPDSSAGPNLVRSRPHGRRRPHAVRRPDRLRRRERAARPGALGRGASGGAAARRGDRARRVRARRPLRRRRLFRFRGEADPVGAGAGRHARLGAAVDRPADTRPRRPRRGPRRPRADGAPRAAGRRRPGPRRARPAADGAGDLQGDRRALGRVDAVAVPDAAVGADGLPGAPRRGGARAAVAGHRPRLPAGRARPRRGVGRAGRPDLAGGEPARRARPRRAPLRRPGTDLTVGLLPSSRFAKEGGASHTRTGVRHMPNIPTEEVYTTPDPERTEGVVSSTKPLDVARLARDGAAGPLRGRPRRRDRGRRERGGPAEALRASTRARRGSARSRSSTARAGSESSAGRSTRRCSTRTRRATSRSATRTRARSPIPPTSRGSTRATSTSTS